MIGMSVSEYCVEVGNTHLSLSTYVGARMKDGFQPLGSVTVIHTQKKEEGVLVPTLLFAQAMVKYATG